MVRSATIIKPGTLTSVQDAGRPGYLGKGIAPGGAMDNAAFRAANLLVGNEAGSRVLSHGPRGAAVLECTISGPELRFDSDVVVAVTGGECTPRVGKDTVQMWTPFTVPAGQPLALGAIRRGLRSYVAVQGGFDVPVYLGSRSTMVAAGLGGHEGRALRTGDVLRVGDPQGQATVGRRFPPLPLPGPEEPCRVRVLRGPQEDRFEDESVAAFHESEWTLTPMTNRMGSRFSGPALRFRPRPSYLDRQAGANDSNIVDDIIPYGGIQCPDGAASIVMNSEHPTAGGYAKIATVISADMRLIAQMRPGQKAVFVRVAREELPAIRRDNDDLVNLSRLEDAS
ncbi:biotin-dependent carboxyltransferase family protein [Streptomyces sp. NPDC000987]|uniref:5-oxoprolinase subunit C family protein n=1 Tax=Streptomyces sp. NPDC000987 TaxID=3154374 RepID=UPI0033212DB1